MRFLKSILIILFGLACGMGSTLAYDLATQSRVVVVDVPGASVASGSSSESPSLEAPQFGDIVAAPDRLIIPKINVDAHIKFVGLDANGDMATPGNPTDVAWYQPGPQPGMLGSAVIDGHLNTKYVKQAVFYNLNKLQSGDEVQVRTVDGQVLVFKVTKVQEYAEDAPAGEIFAKVGTVPYLNLISCAGDWDPVKKVYNSRIVVFTERVS
jgi:LPXTG-site transpeptidase (sortase) family protein